MNPEFQVKVLLVGDDPQRLALLEAALAPLGDSLVLAGSAEEALAQVLESDFAAILLNLDTQSLEAARLLRSSPRSKATPIVFINCADTENACAFGAVDFLTEPVVPAILRAKMGFFVDCYRAKERLEREKSFLEAVLENIEDGIVACDEWGTLTLFNRATKELHGLPQQPLPPEQWAEHYALYGPDGKTPFAQNEVPLFRALAGEFVKDAEMVISPTEGEPRSLLASGQPLLDAQGQKLGAVVSMHDITDRKKAEEAIAEVVREQALRRGEEQVKVILESIRDGFLLMDRDWTIVYMNAAAERINGQSREEIIGKNHWEIFPAAVGTSLHREYLRCAAERISISFENYYEPWDRWFEVDISPGPDGETAVYYRDITERKRYGDALRQSEARNRAVVETALDCIIGMDMDGRITDFNPAAERTFGFQRAEVLGRDLSETIIPPEYREGHRAGMRRYLAGGEARVLDRRLELEAIRNDGERFDCELTVTRIPGEPASFTGFLRDVTEIKRAAAAVKESEERFRLLADTIPNLAWMARKDGHIFWYNQRWYDYTGKTPEEMDGWGWQDVHHPDELPKVLARWQGSIDTGKPFSMVFPLKGADGAFRHFLTLVNPFRGPSGEILFWFGTNTDITEQKQSEDRLAGMAEAEKNRAGLMSQVAAASHSINAVLSVESITRVISEEARRILGTHIAVTSLTRRDEYDQDVSAVSLSEKYAAYRDQELRPDGLSAHVCLSNRPLRLTEAEVELHPEWNGSPGREEAPIPTRGWLGVPLIGHGGRNLGIIQVSDKRDGDFTEEDEAVLAQLAATASVSMENARLYDSLREQDQRKDEFLATLAHELRNPLAPIRTGLEILKVAGDSEQARTARDMMERQLVQMVRLVDDLMDVSRVSRGQIELKLERTTVKKVFEMAVETSRPLIEAARHEISISLPGEPLRLHADITRLAQLLSNLINNAAKYTPDGGRIGLSAHTEGSEIVMCVTDSGIGIPGEMLSKVFDLFTQVGGTLDRSQGGLGIGLSLVRRLAEMHGGSVGAESAGPGQGSTFTVRLPLAAEAAAGPEIAPPAADSAAESRRILVVDDNVDGAESLAMLLLLFGHEARTVHNGPDALVAASEFQPDLIFLDIGLPGMNGYEVARALRQNHGSAGPMVVALTGWGSEDDRQRAREAGFDAHLAKPVKPADVKEIIRNCPRR